jgi:DNA-binding MarR family transcriptional regulator
VAASEHGEPKALSADEEAVWRAFSRMMLVAPRAVDADLLEASRLNFTEYHVLAYLSEQPDRTLRMSSLSELGSLSPSGMTRVVERLTRQGLIERRRSPDDGRGQIAVLTAEGMNRLRAAWPEHVRSVRARIMDHLDVLDREALLAALTAIIAACEQDSHRYGPGA